MKKIKYIELFCGIGGFRLGLKKERYKCVFSSDNDKFSQLTYEKNFGEKPYGCLLYTSPSPRDGLLSRMPSSA